MSSYLPLHTQRRFQRVYRAIQQFKHHKSSTLLYISLCRTAVFTLGPRCKQEWWLQKCVFPDFSSTNTSSPNSPFSCTDETEHSLIPDVLFYPGPIGQKLMNTLGVVYALHRALVEHLILVHRCLAVGHP